MEDHLKEYKEAIKRHIAEGGTDQLLKYLESVQDEVTDEDGAALVEWAKGLVAAKVGDKSGVREILRQEDVTPTGSAHIITVTWVVPDDHTSPRVLECYLDYEPLPRDHPRAKKYEADLDNWAETSGDDRLEPDEPIREHWYLVAEQGVELADIKDAVTDLDTAVAIAPEEVRDDLVRRFLEKKYPPAATQQETGQTDD